MAETYKKSTFEQSKNLAGLPVELTDDLLRIEGQFKEVLGELTETELKQLDEVSPKEEASRDIQQPPFRLDTVPVLGGKALGVVITFQNADSVLTRETLLKIDEKPDDKKVEKEPVSYDEDDKEFDEEVSKNWPRAEAMIKRFLDNGGNSALLSGTHPEWVRALSDRYETNIRLYGSVDKFPESEIFKMTNVCAVGMIKNKSETDFDKRHP